MIDEEMLLGMAATYVARRGLSDEVGRAFGEWLCGEYEEAEGWEDLSPWATEWEAFCLSEDRSVFDGAPMSEVLGELDRGVSLA